VQLDATSGDTRRRLATLWECLLSSRSQVRILLGALMLGARIACALGFRSVCCNRLLCLCQAVGSWSWLAPGVSRPSDLVFPGAGAAADSATASLDQITWARADEIGRFATVPGHHPGNTAGYARSAIAPVRPCNACRMSVLVVPASGLSHCSVRCRRQWPLAWAEPGPFME
jgi:hypothetical protein